MAILAAHLDCGMNIFPFAFGRMTFETDSRLEVLRLKLGVVRCFNVRAILGVSNIGAVAGVFNIGVAVGVGRRNFANLCPPGCRCNE